MADDTKIENNRHFDRFMEKFLNVVAKNHFQENSYYMDRLKTDEVESVWYASIEVSIDTSLYI
jgi:hypothetical protein